MIGTKLGPYEITAKLGEGGMGEVYRAHDTKLERDVAIKVLPAAFVEDHERLARFEREAKLLAQLNHPNIAHIYGMEASGDSHALVMELVEGPTLAERLEQGPLPLDESLSLARQIAAALEEAHEKGIIHRDLKPQNIKASIEGKVKVLDFGLAKAMDPVGAASGAGSASQLAASPTLTLGATQMGVVLGTAAYMAPEQAKGFAVDKRADIWAFGVVLFEMLAGQRLFEGDSVPETLAGVLKSPIDLETLPAEVPAPLRRLLRRCLERNPRNRLRDIGDARLTIDELLSGSAAAASDGAFEPGGAAARRRWPLPLGMAAALVVTAAAAWWLASRLASPAPRAPGAALHLTLPLPAEYPLDDVGGSPLALENTAFDVSADGSRLVYLTRSAGVAKIVAFDVDSGKYRLLAGTDGAFQPAFSPDGRWVAFIADGRLKRIAYAGGGVDDLAAAPSAYALDWNRDGKLYWVGREGTVAWSMEPVLGAPVSTVASPCDCLFIRAGVRPGELVTGGFGSEDVVRLRPDGKKVPLGMRAGDLRVLGDGTLVFTRPGRLMAQRSAAPEARSVTVLDGLRTGIAGQGQFATTATGALFYVAGGDAARAFLVRRDVSGREEKLPFPAADYGAFDARPDGRRIVIGSKEHPGRLEVLDVESKTSQFVDIAGQPRTATLSPDGSHVAVAQHGAEGWSVVEYAIASAAPPKTLFASPHALYTGSWSHDGRYLAFAEGDAKGSWISVWDRETGASKPLAATQSAKVWAPSFSPDDRELAYTVVDDSGSQVYVVPFPTGDQRWLVSGGTGEEPQWRQDEAQLVFRRGQEWYGVSYHDEGGFTFEAPRLLFRGPYLNILGMEYRVLADGSTLLLAPEERAQGTDHLDVIVHWLDQVHRELAGAEAR